MKHRRVRTHRLSAVFVFLFLGTFFVSNIISVRAEELQQRSVHIADEAPSATTTHTFQFDTVTAATVGSIELEYCTNDPLVGTPCTAPSGLSVLGASIGSESGITGLSVSGSSTTNVLVLTRTPAFAAAQTSQYVLDSVVNPSVGNEIVYVRVSVYDGANATGTRIDSGGVVFVTDNSYDIQAFVPPHLTFCVGVTVSVDCSTASGSLVGFGELNASSTESENKNQAAVLNSHCKASNE